MFEYFWKNLHVFAIGFLIAGVAFNATDGFSFGMGPGLNPPVDIHVPTSEEIGDEVQDTMPSPVIFTNEDGNTYEVV